MLNSIFTGTEASAFTIQEFLTASAVSVVLGLAIMFFYSFKNSTASRNFLMTLAILPIVVQTVIMVVNGNVGTGVAVAGAFSLVRFRSVPGNARDICCIFLAMAMGLATGTGYIALAVLLVLIVGIMNMVFALTGFAASDMEGVKELTVTIPESLDYTGAFDDIFDEYTESCDLSQVRTTNMGSLYKLKYMIRMKDESREKQMLDELRCRNGNLDIICGHPVTAKKESL